MKRNVVLVAALVVAVAPAGARAAHPCRSALPPAPAVPAPVVLWTSCGSFRLDPRDGVSRLRRHWLAAHGGGSGRRFGAHVALRRNRAGRFFLREAGRLLWRSHGVYPGDGGSVAFGPHAFAFASRRRGVFLTDLVHGERLVARGRALFPYSFDDRGRLLVAASRSVAVIARDGTRLGRFRFRARNGFAADEATGTFYFVSEHGFLAAARGGRVRLLRSVRGVDGTLVVARPRLLIFSGAHSLTVTRRDGSAVARADWSSSGLSSDSGVAVSADGHAFAFRLTDAHPGATSGRGAVYLLRAGATRARELYRFRLGPSGCAVGANISWHGRYLLYAGSDGARVVIDSATRRTTDLTALAQALPRRSRGERAAAAWRSDFRR